MLGPCNLGTIVISKDVQILKIRLKYFITEKLAVTLKKKKKTREKSNNIIIPDIQLSTFSVYLYNVLETVYNAVTLTIR